MSTFKLSEEIYKIKENGPLVLGWDSMAGELRKITSGYAVVFTGFTLKEHIYGPNIRRVVSDFVLMNGSKPTNDAISLWSDEDFVYADIANVFTDIKEALFYYYRSQQEGILGQGCIVDCSKKRYREITFQ